MDLLRHHRSLALLIFVLATNFSLSAAEHPHRHHHNGTRHIRQSESPQHYYYENFDSNEYGNWGPWTPASECSRSCGGGVAYDTRQCYSTRPDGTPFCRGSARRYYSCNIHDCPDPYFDFRAYQCSLFDQVPFDKFYYKWIPYTKGSNKCELNCMPMNERFYYRHKKQVIDGTLCDDEKQDICVNGKCLPVGCDRLLGSPAREDLCRVCNGDGSTCKTVRGILDRNDLQVGYNDLLLVPQGAVNIRVREVQPSNNYLAIRNLTGHYYLNGNWRIDFPKKNRFVGTMFNYERRSLGLASPESITALGPITESIYIVILYQERNTGIEYEYSLPKNFQTTDPDGYRWKYGEFSNCSATCGGGYRTRRVWCAKRRDDTAVSNNLCDPAQEPIKNQTCSAQPCPPQWIVGEWSECSHSCGFNGTQSRTVHCEQIISDGKPTIVENYRCTANGEEAPPTNQSCNVGLPCPKWYVGPWKACDKLCGDGFHRRDVRCYYKIDGRISVTKDSNCPETKPEFQKPCFLRPCEGVDWIISEWSGCSDQCDVTTETKTALCSTIHGKTYPDKYCKKSKLPALVRECKAPACEYLWYANQWSECSSKCGPGIQTRKVFCGTVKDDKIIKVADAKCDPKKKEETRRNCTGTGVCQGDWLAGPWSACSKKCSGGTMTRKVFCFVNNKTVPISNCNSDDVLSSTADCNNQPCGADQLLPVEESKPVVEEDTEYECENEADNVVTIPINAGLDEHLNNESVIVVAGTESMAETEISTENVESSTPVLDETSSDLLAQTENASTQLEESSTPADESSTPVEKTVRRKRSSSNDTSTLSPDTTDFNTTDSNSTDSSTTEESTTDTATEMSTEMFTDLLSNITDSATLNMTESDTNDLSNSSDTSVESDSTSEPDNSTESFNPTESTISSETVSQETSSLSISSDMSSESSDVTANDTSSMSSESSSSSSEIPTNTEGSSETYSTSPDAENSSETSASSSDTSSSEYSTITVDFSGSSPRVNPISSIIETETTTKQCKKVKKKPKCESSEFGCCIDGKSFATGPFSAGCPEMSTCQETVHGCCPDEVTPADSAKGENCPKILCKETLFGCCPDGISTATGNDNEGCPIETTTLEYSCKDSQYGCCPNGISAASGPDFSGCFECLDGSGDCSSSCNETLYGCCLDGFTPALGPNFTGCYDDTTTETEWISSSVSDESTLTTLSSCVDSEFGCCEDNETAASGPNGEGCHPKVEPVVNCTESKFGCCDDGVTPASGKNKKGCKPACESEPYGCCYDNMTAAHGPNKEGCCLNTPYGCCPDNVLAATGPNLEGCGCQYSPYGCCPDNTTAARGHKKEGCGCEYTEFGCCPNKYTEAKGPNYEGCPCYTYQFGCCPDGVTRARGPSFQGCSCEHTDFGCCSDGKTPAPNASRICTCEASKYGCCPDGITEARDDDFLGCDNIPLKPGDICTQQKDHGPCRDFSVKWFFDQDYGSCSRFWYGGCEGNPNRFKSQDECKSVCVEPVGRDACFLPKIQGPCEGYYPSWYYDPKVKQCRQFIYSGCLGNNNKFQTFAECEQLCMQSDRLEPCDQAVSEGPCKGNFSRWYFDKKEGSCKTFNYGGCKGNRNNFLTEMACQQQCLKPGKSRPAELCGLPKDKGPCPGTFIRWFYNATDKVCQEFVYGGCLGNLNRFETKEECSEQCPSDTTNHIEEECLLPRAPGNGTEKNPRWFFDQSENRCAPFYYSGFGGNTNNFQTRDICEKYCPPRVAQQLCTLPAIPGECYNYTERWYFNSLENQCRLFYYGGCGGNENNFRTEYECRYRCVSSGEAPRQPPTPPTPPTLPRTSTELSQVGPALTQADVCRQPADPGPCDQQITSWHYDTTSGKCLAFSYSGCGGNQNRFENENHCTRYCSFLKTSTEIAVTFSPNRFSCEVARRECEDLKNCPYGVERWMDSDNCERCSCYNPCKSHECPANQQCSLDAYRNSEGNAEYRPVCRLIQKPGGCPYLNDSQQCGVSCRTDADCLADDKCCSHNCGNACVPPVTDGSYTGPVSFTTPAEQVTPPQPSGEYAPQIDDANTEFNVESEEGNYATLRCVAIGNPKPVITWRKGETIIDRSVSRYKLTDGILQIVSLRRSDAGVYICSASNGVGVPASKQFTLNVKDPVERPAEILYDAVPTAVVTLGEPTTLRCYAYGYPYPSVTWWKEERIIGLNQTDLYRRGFDHSLVITRVTLRALGPYTCQAYNGKGRAASWTLTLHAVGPTLPLSVEDQPYAIYLIQPPTSPIPTSLPSPPTSFPEPPSPTEHVEYTVPVQTTIQTNESVYAPGSELSIPCTVDGYPTPQVAWYKNNEPIVPNEKISISETFRLQIRDVSTNDSGEYRCTAINKYASSSSSITISVEGTYIHPNCTDNPLFANCDLIVKGKFCKHKYYAKFCCRSCTLVGQLPPINEHDYINDNSNYYQENGPQFKRQARHARSILSKSPKVTEEP